MLSQNFIKMYCIPPYQRRIQKFCKRGGVREAVFQLRHTLSQMPKVNYTHFIREKATYWREKKGYWSQLVGSAPPLFPGLIGHWCVLSLVTPLLVVCYDQYQRFMYCLCHSSLVIATLLPFSCSICLKQYTACLDCRFFRHWVDTKMCRMVPKISLNYVNNCTKTCRQSWIFSSDLSDGEAQEYCMLVLNILCMCDLICDMLQFWQNQCKWINLNRKPEDDKNVLYEEISSWISICWVI